VIFDEQHLRHLLNSYQGYYNESGTHLSLKKDAPIPRDTQAVGRVLALPILVAFTIGTSGFEYPTGTGLSHAKRATSHPAWPASVRFKPCDSADPLRSWFAPRITGDEKSPRPLSRQDNWHGKSRPQALGLLAPHLAPEPAEALAAAKTTAAAKVLGAPWDEIASRDEIKDNV
jgi:hypothetical protein